MINKKIKIIRNWLQETWGSGNYTTNKNIHINEITPCTRDKWLQESFKMFYEIEQERKQLGIHLVLVLAVDLEFQITPFEESIFSWENINTDLDKNTPPSLHLWDDKSMNWLSNKGRIVQNNFFPNDYICRFWESNDKEDPREINRVLFFYLKEACLK